MCLLKSGELRAWCWVLNKSPTGQEAVFGVFHIGERNKASPPLAGGVKGMNFLDINMVPTEGSWLASS